MKQNSELYAQWDNHFLTLNLYRIGFWKLVCKHNIDRHKSTYQQTTYHIISYHTMHARNGCKRKPNESIMQQTDFRFKKVPFQVLSKFCMSCLNLSFLIFLIFLILWGSRSMAYLGPCTLPVPRQHTIITGCSVQKPRLESRVGSQITKLVALSSLTRFNLFKFH